MTLTEVEKSVRDLKAKARLNLVAFRHTILQSEETDQEVDPADFHYAWSDSILQGTDHEVWEAFRESAKTQYILRSFPLYQLTFPQARFDYIVLIKNNSTLAGNKLKEISKEYLENKITSANLVTVLQDSSNVFHAITVDADGKEIETRIEAYGKGASIRGASYKDKRPKICIIDDPQDTEDAKSEVILEADWNWFLSDILFLGKSTRIFLIGNNLGDKCIVERVMNKAQSFEFVNNRVPIEMDGKATWPAKFSTIYIAKEKDAYRNAGKLDIWLRERMCQSTSEETRTFDLKDFPRFSHTEIPDIARHAKISATLDPASSQNASACYRAICINAVTVENYWMIIEMRYGRWDSVKLVDEIFQSVCRWGLRSFAIEKGQLFDVLEPFLKAKMVADKVFFDLVPLEHAKRGSKLERIKMLAPRAKAHSIWLPDYAPSVDGMPPWITELELELTGVTKDQIKSEYIDLVDALAMQDQVATAPSEKGNPQGSRTRRTAQRTYAPRPSL